MFFVLLCALAAPTRTLAVLEFESKLPKDTVDAQYLADVVRTAAKDAAPSLKVITRESMLVLLEASGKKLEDCQGECEVDTGRRLGADLVISGQVLKFGTQFKVNMKMHDTRSGELLQGAQASGKTLDELDTNLNAAVRKLLTPIESAEPAAPPPEPQRQLAPQVTAAPPPAASGPPAPAFGGGVTLLAGYYSWSIDVPNSNTVSDLTWGLEGEFYFRLKVLEIGAQLGYDWLQYDNINSTTSTSTKETVNGLTAGLIGRVLLPSNWALFVGAGYLSLSQDLGSGYYALGGVDIPVAGPFFIRALAEYRHASASVSAAAGGSVDVASSIVSASAAAALLF